MQADSADGAVITQAVLGFLSMVSSENDRDVVVVEACGAGRIDATFKEAHGVAHDRSMGGNGGQTSSGTSCGNAPGIDGKSGRKDGSDRIVESVHHVPVNQVFRLGIADKVECI